MGASNGPRATATAPGSVARLAWVVFATFAAMYAATAGARGYSIDGEFAYRLARDAVTRGPVEAARAQSDLLRRWGPGLPLLGIPLVAAGETLARHLPPAASVPLDSVPGAARTLVVPLVDLPAISLDTANAPGDPTFIDVPVPSGTGQISALTIISALSFARELPDGVAVATIALVDASGSWKRRTPVPLRAGIETAEWSLGDPSQPPAAHNSAPLAGAWDGNPAARWYRATLPMPGVAADSVRVEATAPAGRLHLRAILATTPDGVVPIVARPIDGETATADRVTRAAFGFANVLPGAATVALLVPIAAAYGATARTALLLAVATGLGTLAWPYARLDFAETLAGACAIGAFAARLAAARATTSRHTLALNVVAGGLAVGAGLAKYTALWFAPLVAIDAILRPGALSRWLTVALFLAPAGAAAVVSFAAGIAAPTVLSELPAGLARGWLGFPVWAGLAGLLVSPGKGLIAYAPPTAIAIAGVIPFILRHRAAAFLPVAAPLVYLLVFGSKGNWHGGGWGPRYLVPMVPFAMVLALPVLARATGGRAPWRAAARAAVAVTLLAGIGVQAVGVLKHPNAYTIMFRDHVAPQLPSYGVAQGGALARAHVAYWGQSKAPSELLRPPGTPLDAHGTPLPERGLGHLTDRDSPLIAKLWPSRAARFALTLYFCNYDGLPTAARHQTVTVVHSSGTQTIRVDDFARGLYATWIVDAEPEVPVTIAVHDSGRDFPVISGLFFDPVPDGAPNFPEVMTDRDTGGAWIGRYGREGAILPAYEMGPRDAGALPEYIDVVTGGIPVWVDTGELERAETALLYAPGFSPIAAHAWLLANDLVAVLFPADLALRQRALASPPWRYVHALEIHGPHPEYGLGIDLWPLAMRDWFASWPRVMAATWALEGAFACGAVAGATALVRAWRRAGRVEA